MEMETGKQVDVEIQLQTTVALENQTKLEIQVAKVEMQTVVEIQPAMEMEIGVDEVKAAVALKI